MDRPRARRALVVLALVGAGAVFVASGAALCPTALAFGLPCPGCGLTRATLALFRGDLDTALHFHPLVFVLAPLFLGALAVSLLDYVRGETRLAEPAWLAGPAGTRLGAGLLVLVLGVWGARFAGFLGGPAPVESWSAVAGKLGR